jgi:glycyl-tRNA synthetase beta chain
LKDRPLPELFLELFSEEIPARMQARAADDLVRSLTEALAKLSPSNPRSFAGPRRIACALEVDAGVAAATTLERGPRRTAPEQALAGFLRKHNAERTDLREEGEFWVLHRSVPGTDAAALVATALPALLRRFLWPKSMRWGGTSQFTWVRPLRRILCILDGAVVPFTLADGGDDGHGLASGKLTEGHRFMSPGAFEVASCDDWMDRLRTRHVLVEAGERRQNVQLDLQALADGKKLEIVPDAGLLDEVAGLVEWPVALLGRIDAAYMDLPAEVMQVSMRVNQRYFALRDHGGAPAPFFGFAANIEASDGGAAIVAGNKRVLRARFSDARHFWDLDRTRRLESRVAALDGITFHAKLGTQGDRARRLERLAGKLAPMLSADPALAARAGRLAKADLTTGMVGEFPELQGVMGGYYARHDGEPAEVADAVRDQYAPKGPADTVPSQPVTVALGLADRLDQLVQFFAVGEKPSGSGDPYALRRAALGIIRLIRENGRRLGMRAVIDAAQASPNPALGADILAFLLERLRVQLRTEGARHDVLSAVLGIGLDDDVTRLLARTDALTDLLATPDGANLLAAYRRGTNILRIEEKKDGPHDRPVDPDALEAPEELGLAAALAEVEPAVRAAVATEGFTAAMAALATLRRPLDAFFEAVTVNAEKPELRRNRLALLARLRVIMDTVADFSRIEG